MFVLTSFEIHIPLNVVISYNPYKISFFTAKWNIVSAVLHWALIEYPYSLFTFIKQKYRTRAIITRGWYTFYPLFEVQKRFFKGLFS